MITAKFKPRPVITLIINDSVGNIELPEFAEDNYCYLSLEKDGTLTLHEDRPFISGNGEWSNQCGVGWYNLGGKSSKKANNIGELVDWQWQAWRNALLQNMWLDTIKVEKVTYQVLV